MILNDGGNSASFIMPALYSAEKNDYATTKMYFAKSFHCSRFKYISRRQAGPMDHKNDCYLRNNYTKLDHLTRIYLNP